MIEGLGAAVTYTDTSGRTKAAIVTATPVSIQDDDQSGIAAPGLGRAHLRVLSFTGNTYDKYDVALGEGPGTFSAPKDLEPAFTA